MLKTAWTAFLIEHYNCVVIGFIIIYTLLDAHMICVCNYMCIHLQVAKEITSREEKLTKKKALCHYIIMGALLYQHTACEHVRISFSGIWQYS